GGASDSAKTKPAEQASRTPPCSSSVCFFGAVAASEEKEVTNSSFPFPVVGVIFNQPAPLGWYVCTGALLSCFYFLILIVCFPLLVGSARETNKCGVARSTDIERTQTCG
ncbi:unnamed protein product, partial [Laminaria digitata]